MNSVAITLLILVALGALPVAQAQPAPQTASEDVPADLAARARSAAERSAPVNKLMQAPRSLFIDVELVRRKPVDGREPPPLYRVRHYRYTDDVTITSLVDLATDRVVQQEEAAHVPVPLTGGELDEARRLVLADAAVSPQLRPHLTELVMEPLMVRTTDPRDPWFGQRVVRLLFRVARNNYLREPVVFVNLSRRTVIVERPHGASHGDKQ